MKRFFRLCWQFLFFPLLFFPYAFVNEFFLVDWLGGRGSRVDIYGNKVAPSFNANHVTLLFWGAVALVVILLSFLHALQIQKPFKRSLFFAATVIVSVWLALLFIHKMLWD